MPFTTRALRRNVLSSLVRASLGSALAATSVHAASVCTVVTHADDPAGASAAVTGLTSSGTLRDCILASNLLTGSIGAPAGGMTIAFDPAAFTGGAANTITLGDSLPMIFNNTMIDASALTQPVVIDGGNAHRIFFVSGLPDSTQDYNTTGRPDPDGAQAISATFKNLLLRNGKAKGGDGSGGGLGAGGALFVNQNATVVLSDVGFSGNAARGGNFGANGRYAGGGGMGGDGMVNGGGLGGSGVGTGGGIGTDGQAYVSGQLPSGGGFGGTGIGQISNEQGFGAAFNGGVWAWERDDPLKSGGIGGGGGLIGRGGFGGGGGDGGFAGGGYAGCNQYSKYDCKGGFGGGGGHGRNGTVGSDSEHYAGTNGTVGGLGGFGGGGGGGGGGGDCKEYLGDYHPGHASPGGQGGVGGGGGGSGTDGPDDCSIPGTTGPGGGGAGFGGAVFVRKGGSLTVKATGNRVVSGNSVVSGTGYRDGAAAGAGFFLMSDVAPTFDISGRYTISDDIGDDSITTLPAGQPYTPGAGVGLTVFKVGTGTLVLDGANTFSGLVAVGAGALAGNGDVSAQVLLADGAAISPGDPAIAGGVGTLSIGQLVWTAGSSISFQLGKTQAASDLLMIGGGLIKNGAGLPMRVNFGIGASPPVAGVTYTILTAQSLAGVAASDFYHVEDATYANLGGHFSIVGNSVTFTVDSVTSDRIFAGSFD